MRTYGARWLRAFEQGRKSRPRLRPSDFRKSRARFGENEMADALAYSMAALKHRRKNG